MRERLLLSAGCGGLSVPQPLPGVARGVAASPAGFIARACGLDEELRRRVERLVDAHFQAGSFLESPPASPTVSIDSSRATEVSGTVIGPYKLLQPIGEGGMGTVYMAELTAPVHRLVALKVIKAGMDSRQVLARFGADRQALALMDHPNIAKVLDIDTRSDVYSLGVLLYELLTGSTPLDRKRLSEAAFLEPSARARAGCAATDRTTRRAGAADGKAAARPG